MSATTDVVKRAAQAHIRTIIAPDSWKLCLSDTDKSQLFNLQEDPYETTNLFESGKYQDTVNTLFQNEKASFEVEMERKNGEKFPAKIIIILTKDSKGKIIGFLMIGEDITRLKENEEKLRRQVEELERFKRATIQRELRMKELKDRLKKVESGGGSLDKEKG